ncbi:hypothetical protein K439DRAFT_1068638 [Ramaria rubella]|nr:hypothetical protein K439DRAFT_1068638 [Ramaria rubella]
MPKKKIPLRVLPSLVQRADARQTPDAKRTQRSASDTSRARFPAHDMKPKRDTPQNTHCSMHQTHLHSHLPKRHLHRRRFSPSPSKQTYTKY